MSLPRTPRARENTHMIKQEKRYKQYKIRTKRITNNHKETSYIIIMKANSVRRKQSDGRRREEEQACYHAYI